MKDYEKKFCQECSIRPECTFVRNGREARCSEMATFGKGYEQALHDIKESIDRLGTS